MCTAHESYPLSALPFDKPNMLQIKSPSVWIWACLREGVGSGKERFNNIIAHCVRLIGRFYTALFSTLEHTHCALVACGDYKWVTVALYRALLNVHPSGILTELFGCDMAGATWNCCRLGAFCAHQATIHQITSLHAKATYVGCMHD